MRNDFRIGLRVKDRTDRGDLIAQVEIIFDYAVMDDRNAACLMRMGVANRRCPMRRPTRMSNAAGRGGSRL